MQIPSTVNQAVTMTKARSPEIMSAGAILGLGASCVLSTKATLKAREIIREEEPETRKDALKLVAPTYIPPVVAIAATVALILGANRVNATRVMAATTLYGLSEKSLSDYRAKVVEKLGEKGERDITDEIAQETIAEKPTSQVFVTNTSDVLFYEPLTGRYFESDMETVRRAQNDLNATLHRDLFASLSDFFDLINLPPTRMSEEMGWNADRQLDLSFSTTISADNRPCIVLDYLHSPTVDYMRRY